MKKIKGIVFIIFLFSVYCGISQTQGKNSKIIGTYSNTLYKKENEKTSGTFLQLLGLKSTVCDSVQLSIHNEEAIKIDFKDIYGPCYEMFKGKQKRRHFEFYLQKKRIYIPFLYGYANIIRFRIKYLENGNLEIQEYRNNCSNVLFMASGGSSIYIYLLKK